MRDGPRSGARWWAIGSWSLRWKVTALVALPLAAALALGGVRISTELANADRFRGVASEIPILSDLGSNSLALVNADVVTGTPNQTNLDAAQNSIDQFQRRFDAVALTHGHDEFVAMVKDMQDGLANAKSLTPSAQFAIDNERKVSEDAWRVYNALTGPISDNEVDGQSHILLATQLAESSLFTELVAAVNTAHKSKISISSYELTSDVQHALTQAAMSEYQSAADVQRASLNNVALFLGADDPNVKTLQGQLNDRITAIQAAVAGKDFSLPAFRNSLLQSASVYTAILSGAQNRIISQVQSLYNDNRAAAIRESILLGLGLLIELLFAGLAARSLIVPLRRLRRAAFQMADRDLPAEIDRIKDGAGVDDVIMEPMPVYTREEVGQLARAVDNIHGQALRLAGEQAQLRLQVSDMFETLARRSKSLVDHQLGVIEAMEYEEKDPKLLEGLFRLDHLAARMRRNSDNLLILAGTKARRTKAAPVEIGDVLRAAISEVEEYQRVKLGATPRGSLTEPAASDIAHLFAELLDNALRASPPETDVKFTFAQANDQGLLIEVADRGIGIPAGDLDAINKRLEAGADISTDTARHMGLFVVSRLAERHGLTVRMRPTFDIARDPGVTVTVHVPRNLIIGGSVLPGGAKPLTPARPPMTMTETTNSGQIRQVTRTAGGNMMVTVDPTGERPSLPQRHPGGAILPDPLPRTALDDVPTRATGLRREGPSAPPPHAGPPKASAGPAAPSRSNSGGLPQRVPGARGPASGTGPDLPQRRSLQPGGDSGIDGGAGTGFDRSGHDGDHPAAGTGEFIVGDIHHTSPRGFAAIEEDPPLRPRAALPMRRRPPVEPVDAAMQQPPDTAEFDTRAAALESGEQPRVERPFEARVEPQVDMPMRKRPPVGDRPLFGAVPLGNDFPAGLESPGPQAPVRPVFDDRPISELPVFDDQPDSNDPAAKAAARAAAQQAADEARAEAAAEARRAWEEAGDAGRHGGRSADTVKTASFFQSRLKEPTAEDTQSMPIFAEMMSGWLADWQQGMPRPAFESIADEGWSAAQRVAAAATTEVTESGLPQRRPGERLIPGAVGGNRTAAAANGASALTGGGSADKADAASESVLSHRITESGAGPARRRDPDTIRASLASHQSGVRNGRAMTTTQADEGDR